MTGKLLKDLNLKPGDRVKALKDQKGSCWAYPDWWVVSKDGIKVFYRGDSAVYNFIKNCVWLYEVVSRAEPEYKIWGNMTSEEKGALLLAHHEGKSIQFCSLYYDWIDCKHGPLWLNDWKYRIKPKEPVVETIILDYYPYLDGEGTATNRIQDKGSVFTHRITFNEIDGEVDVNSIKMVKL